MELERINQYERRLMMAEGGTRMSGWGRVSVVDLRYRVRGCVAVHVTKAPCMPISPPTDVAASS